MKGIRDFSSLYDSLYTLKAIMFVTGKHFLCKTVLDAINELKDYETLDDLRFDMKIPVLYAVNYLSQFLLDLFFEYGSFDIKSSKKDILYDKIEYTKKQLNSIKILL